MAAARCLGRFITESPAITIGEAGLAAAAIQELAGRDSRLASDAQETSRCPLSSSSSPVLYRIGLAFRGDGAKANCSGSVERPRA